MKAMILSAGYGKRLRPLTLKCPKPLLKIGDGGETLLSNTLKFLKQSGIKDVVINIHYLGDQIVDYINSSNFDLSITIIDEKKNLLDTGGSVLNAIKNFSNEPFLIVNPDTIWKVEYMKELELMKKIFFEKSECKCLMLVVDKVKSFDKNFKGDFNLKNNLINRENKENLKYIYTGIQIVKPEIFYEANSKIFSINKIWDNLIKAKKLYGTESSINFLHVSTLDIYQKLLQNFKH